MSSKLRTPEDYELFLYILTEQYPSVLSSTLVFIRRGAEDPVFVSNTSGVAGKVEMVSNVHATMPGRSYLNELTCVKLWLQYSQKFLTDNVC